MKALIFFILVFSGVASTFAAQSPDQLFATLAKSVFVVEAYASTGKLATQGSGIAIGSGEIVTNCHVVHGSDTLRVSRDGKKHNAKLIAVDKTRDLCVLRYEGLVAPPVLQRSSRSLKVGERVYTIGAPLGLEMTFADGIISSLRRVDGGFMIQTTAPISPGSSGGGLFDSNGSLIGITSFQTIRAT